MNAPFDKGLVSKSFSNAAKTYDNVAGLQRKVGWELSNSIPAEEKEAVLDLGSGTGYFTSKLKKRFNSNTIISVDLAHGMLAYARDRGRCDDALLICGDAESIPLADRSVNLIFSSLAIQWCNDLERLFKETYRVLKSEGMFCFATLGPKTLYELSDSWGAVDDFVHVNNFVSLEKILDIASKYFEVQKLNKEYVVLEYEKLSGLTNELKKLGAHNVSLGRNDGLTGRDKLRRLNSAYEAYRLNNGMLPATYEVLYFYLGK